MELDKSFDPHSIESCWYPFWEKEGLFKARNQSNTSPYSILLPPPNVTGTLHMGHAFQHTLMDALIRYHRMQGDNTLWQAGTDHAGIATQIVVERQLESQGLDRRTLGRDSFLEKVWQWKEHSGSTITRQMRRMGSSCDWERERFTMDEGLSKAVNEVFVRLYQQGLIYRGKRLVNWDPVLQTAVSDLEVISEEEQGFLWHIRYPIVNQPGQFLVVATTRPETLFGDMAVAVNPQDDRYQSLIGQYLALPLTDKHIPIIADDYVDSNFGTGCVKITPAHDFNDYQVGLRHQLIPINIFTKEAKLNEHVPTEFQGLDRFVARQKVLEQLESQGLLAESKKHTLMVPRGDRTRSVIEPMLSDQWFVKMEGFAQQALELVSSGQIRFIPENWTNTYNHWLTNIQDWCISRQLWWGHRIPAWYDENGNVFVAHSEAEAQSLAANKKLKQDDDVLDTWFSSALWPFSTLGWPDKTKELDTYLPTNVLVTGFDIIFFWVARMIMMTNHFTGKIPFQEVYITGLVRDAHGQKMSKSKGNILDPIDLIDGIDLESLVHKRTSNLMDPKQAKTIEKATRNEFPKGIQSFGTDALRFTFASLATHGRDIKFDLQRCEGYRNFCNKIWNATRYVLMNLPDHESTFEITPRTFGLIDRWMLSRLNQAIKEVREGFDTYRFDMASRSIYQLVWDEYCDWYVELAKTSLGSTDQDIQYATRYTLIHTLETILRLTHPLMPFITEELWQKIAPLMNRHDKSIMVAPYPEFTITQFDDQADKEISLLKELVNACRTLRSEMNLSPKDRVPLLIVGNTDNLHSFADHLAHLGKLSEVQYVDSQVLDNTTAPVAVVGDYKLMLKVEIDVDAEIQRLNKQIEKLTIEINKARQKLSNTSFVDKAPVEVVNQEKERLTQFEKQVTDLTVQVSRLKQ
ncbi:MAG: valine--tRNA ligase [Betaproteobacteria bacterium]|uniref:valine--tRNA ligase n=1 Tax=Ferrovum sp. PN-J185 TaxID=1356306 RepID=UPI000831687C|nr:valine--tRNA ligase [Betaproteobacteria bacterium]MDE2055827.1 valine--tRNA ligase [Betaproteobacteria bacterium]